MVLMDILLKQCGLRACKSSSFDKCTMYDIVVVFCLHLLAKTIRNIEPINIRFNRTRNSFHLH